MKILLLAATGLLAGIISGMGIGGGAILIPALTVFFKISQKQAQGINLLYFAPTAIAAVIVHIRNRSVETKTVWPLIIFGVCGAVAGAILALKIDMGLLKRLFGGFLVLMGVMEFFKKK